jgi:hypothetical protein
MSMSETELSPDLSDLSEVLSGSEFDEVGNFGEEGDVCHDNEILALRNQTTQLQEQVKDLTRQLQQTCSHHQPNVFHYFPQLPPELRRKIWYHALPGPRVVSFDFVHRSRDSMPHFETNHGPPTLLHVCNESREVALESYDLAFQPKGSSRPAFYFAFKRDTLCFTKETTPISIVLFLEDIKKADVRRVRYLAVSTELPKDVVKYITQFRGLEVFSLILSDPRVIMPAGKFDLVEASHRTIWVMGAYWNHGLTSWGSMEMNLTSAFEDERELHPDCNVPQVEFVYAVSTDAGCCKDCPGHEQQLNV